MTTIDEQMKSNAMNELRGYRRLIEQCRHRAFQEEAELRNCGLPPEEHRIRAAMIWAKFTLGTADVELASLAIASQLVEAESLKPIRPSIVESIING